MSNPHMQSPKKPKKIQEHIVPQGYVTSKVEVIKGIIIGAKIVWITIRIFTISLITITVITSLLIALFVIPEARQSILGLIERLFGVLLGLR